MPYRYRVLACSMAGITMCLIDTTVVNVALARQATGLAFDAYRVTFIAAVGATCLSVFRPGRLQRSALAARTGEQGGVVVVAR